MLGFSLVELRIRPKLIGLRFDSTLKAKAQYPNYSVRKASVGFIEAARRAGT